MKDSSSMRMCEFPDDFLWGASTAAHQVEGGMHNQWSEWEHANAERLAKTFSKRLHWLPHYEEVKPLGTDPANYISGRGVEHYQRYREDFDILARLNMNAFRFSIEWSRIEPQEGAWDENAIGHYREYIAELKKRQIEPVLTLWHWTMPVWFTDKGGFAQRRNIGYFERFVRKVGQEYGRDLRYIVTLNEPNVYTALSYASGEWPPQGRNPLTALAVYYNLVLAHRRAYYALKEINPKLLIGTAMALSNELPKDAQNPLDAVVAGIADYSWNRWFLDRLRRTQDFIGVNHYFTNFHAGLATPTPAPKNDLGWYMNPAGIERVLERAWQRYQVPLIITENGLADMHDTHRRWWLEETMAAIRHTLAQGIEVRGYLHWSLLDNFEWAYGWWPKFGLVAVDRETMKRTIRPSAHWFARRIKEL